MGWGAGAGAEIQRTRHRPGTNRPGSSDRMELGAMGRRGRVGEREDEVGWAKGDDGDKNHGRVTKRKWKLEPGKGAKGREVKGPCGIMLGWVVGHTGKRRSRPYLERGQAALPPPCGPQGPRDLGPRAPGTRAPGTQGPRDLRWVVGHTGERRSRTYFSRWSNMSVDFAPVCNIIKYNRI